MLVAKGVKGLGYPRFGMQQWSFICMPNSTLIVQENYSYAELANVLQLRESVYPNYIMQHLYQTNGEV